MKSAATPSPPPSTTPVATSRPRRRWTPMASIVAEAAIPATRNPQNWLTPIRNAAAPPVVAMSARECPANDWVRSTENTPMMPEVIAAIPPMSSAVRTGPLVTGYHHDPAPDVQDVHRVSVQLGQPLGRDDLVRAP